MKNKGFTLIELLAVIVILAIIALIATPIILNIINEARVEGRKRSAEAVGYAVESAYLTAMMKAESAGTSGGIAIKTIMENTSIDNENTRDNQAGEITTKDGVKCTLTGTDPSFTLTCLDTKRDNAQIYEKDLTGNSTSTTPASN